VDVDPLHPFDRYVSYPVHGYPSPIIGNPDEERRGPEVEAERGEDDLLDDAGSTVGELDRNALGAAKQRPEERPPGISRRQRARQPT
jgi:hypothetical protein